MSPEPVEDTERERFYEIDKMIFDQKLFGGVYEYEADPDEMKASKIDPSIFKTDKEYFQYFRNNKSAYIKLKEKINMVRLLIDRSLSQAKSMFALMKFSISQYENAKEAKTRLVERFKEETLRNADIVSALPRSLEEVPRV